MFWILVLNVLLLTFSSSASVAAQPQLSGVHANLNCQDCHGDQVDGKPSPSSLSLRAGGCVGCHQGYDKIFDQAMTTRQAEKQFCERTFSSVDPNFFANTCTSCHVSDCLDCHGGDGHSIRSAAQDDCLNCHTGYFVGPEYQGLAPREDHPRYQRGPQHLSRHYLKMRPDIHAEMGLECHDCHTMESLISGQVTAKSCRDCHQPDPQIIEHSISAHMDKLECYACHSAWSAQEYGTFYLHFGQQNRDLAFDDFKATSLTGDYLVRAYLRRQGSAPLGLNQKGKVSPIRPQFISYYSDLRGGAFPLVENRLLSAEWKAFFPHTIRRGTAMCDSCHSDARRYLLEADEDRIYRIDEDGLGLSSFWNQRGQKIGNGAFVTPEKFIELQTKDANYTKAYVQRWKTLLGHDEKSSKD